MSANANESHMLTHVVVGKSKKPRAVKDIMQRLPVHYYNSQNAWFTVSITSDWFIIHAVVEIRHKQVEDLKIPADEVKAIILLNNAPSHHNIEKLCSRDGRIRCQALIPNTTSAIQPMDQGVIYATKWLYKRKILDEVKEVEETSEDQVEDTGRQRTFRNLKLYNFRSSSHNFAASAKEVKATILIKSWEKLL
ncbi:tigger transposable element-derived protein 7-like [Homarus americanus]|uniref:tigger transposable element-derived protein 7-like n=1 Tax=Homarus americanus TaxID=6706 RepID=UPI001C450578|nr:tigger transposable element-derived protein 7-like [Homarus americanus]